MVAVLEKVRLETKERFLDIRNPFDERGWDYTVDNVFSFERGKIYGVVCEYGGGGEAISLLLTNETPREEEKVYFDDVEVDAGTVQRAGWYMGKPLYSGKLIKREISIRKALDYALKKYHKYESIDGIIEDFGLTPGRLHYGLSTNCFWEKWRASMAIGYASNKIIFCFPWMNTLTFYDCLYNSAVFRLFKRLKKEGAIIILPTSRKENVEGFVDEVIQIGGQRFEQVISDTEYFKQYF